MLPRDAFERCFLNFNQNEIARRDHVRWIEAPMIRWSLSDVIHNVIHNMIISTWFVEYAGSIWAFFSELQALKVFDGKFEFQFQRFPCFLVSPKFFTAWGSHCFFLQQKLSKESKQCFELKKSQYTVGSSVDCVRYRPKCVFLVPKKAFKKHWKN